MALAMLVSSSEGFCLDGLVAAILFRAAAMVAGCGFCKADQGGMNEISLDVMMEFFLGGKVSDLCAEGSLGHSVCVRDRSSFFRI